MNPKLKKVLDSRRSFCRRYGKFSLSNFIALLNHPEIPPVLVAAVRDSLAKRCGISAERIHPHHHPEELRPLMMADPRIGLALCEPDFGGLDSVEFVVCLEDSLSKAGVKITLPNNMAEFIPEFGYVFGTPFWSKTGPFPPPEITVGDWVVRTAEVMMKYRTAKRAKK